MLVKAVVAAELVDTLNTGGPFTVFAPKNSAFAKIPPDTLNELLADKTGLTSLLLRHVVPSEIRAKDVPKGETELTTAGDEKITVMKSGTDVKITSSAGSAKVVRTDILAENGVIHIVDNIF